MRQFILVAAAALLVAGCNTTKQEQASVETQTYTQAPQYRTVSHVPSTSYTTTYTTPQTYTASRNTGIYTSHRSFGWSDPPTPAGNVGKAPGYMGPVRTVNVSRQNEAIIVVPTWSSYREFCFDGSDSTIREVELSKVTEIADYMKNNPSAKIGIDGKASHLSIGGSERNLSDNRVSSIRDALIDAGVSASQIQMGAFGYSISGTSQCVEILLSSDL